MDRVPENVSISALSKENEKQFPNLLIFICASLETKPDEGRNFVLLMAVPLVPRAECNSSAAQQARCLRKPLPILFPAILCALLTPSPTLILTTVFKGPHCVCVYLLSSQEDISAEWKYFITVEMWYINLQICLALLGLVPFTSESRSSQ